MNNWGDKGVHAFLKGISLNVNVIAPLEFELTYYETAVQAFSNYVTGISLFSLGLLLNWYRKNYTFYTRKCNVSVDKFIVPLLRPVYITNDRLRESFFVYL